MIPQHPMDMNLRELLTTLDDPRHTALLRIYVDNRDLYHYAKGSGYNHQAWRGGYADHIAECIRINRIVYPALNNTRPLPFTSASADIALYLHDVEKPYRYGPTTHTEVQRWHKCMEGYLDEMISPDEAHAWEMTKWDIIDDYKTRYGLTISPDEENALTYTHGEGSHHKKTERVSTPLAAHVHHCDNTSARIWHDEGQDTSA